MQLDRQSGRTLALFGAGLFLLGCLPALPIFPAPRPVTETQRSVLEPVERLGRWHDGEFVDVTPGSIPASHLHVIVHGWAPGWARPVLMDPTLRAWRARDEHGEPFEPWAHELARVITENDPYAVVVSYSWLEHAGTSHLAYTQRQAWSFTELHGRNLADALAVAEADDFRAGGGQVHLIGHSYGARVTTIAAIRMHDRPRQLTIFESPDSPLIMITGSQNRLHTLLSKLPIGNGEGEIFVDNYYSMIGVQYRSAEIAGIVDVALTPPFSTLAYRPRHLYPMEFYALSATESFGMGWSPLLLGQPPAPGCYEQPYGEMDLISGCSPQLVRP